MTLRRSQSAYGLGRATGTSEGNMAMIAATLLVRGEVPQCADRKKQKASELGGVLENFMLSLAAIVIVVGVALYLAGTRPYGGF